MGVKLGNGKWAIKEDKLLAYNDNSGRFFNKEFDFSRGSSATYVAKDGLIKTAGLQETNLVNNGDFSELGSELVTNGNFDTDSDWNKTGTWSVESNYATASGNSTSQYIQQDFTITNSKVYKFTYEIIENTLNGNGASLSSSGGFGSVSLSNVVGYHTEYITASNQSATYALKIGVSGTATSGQITIDNISVKQVDPNDYWTITNNTGTDTIIKDGYAEIKTDGAYTQIEQTNVTISGKTYKLQYTVLESDEGNLGLVVTGNTVVSIPNTVGTHNFYFIAHSTSFILKRIGGALDISITNISVQEIQADTPRIDFSDSVKGALLLEPQSTNLVTYSEDFSQWGTVNGVVVTDNFATSPDGTQNAAKVVYDGTSLGRIEISTGASGTNTQSIYLKTVSGTQAVSIGSSSSDLTEVTVTSEWQRFTHTGSGSYPRVLCNDATTIFVWGAMLEQKSFSTSYIPNHGVSGGVTRLADVCNNSGSAQDFNSEEGVLYAEIAALADDSFRQLTISSGSNSNSVSIMYTITENQVVCFVNSGGITQASISTILNSTQEFNKIAISYKLNYFSVYINGFQIAVDTSGILPTSLNTLNFDSGSGSANFYGKVRELQVFTEALTDEQLQKLTTI